MLIMILDTETAPITVQEEVNPYNMLTYDVGFQIVNPHTSEVAEEGSYIIRQIFYGQSSRMQSAYYANKIPQYNQDVRTGKRKVVDWFELVTIISDLYHKYHFKAICAHNARFDVCALNKTMMWLSYGQASHVLPDVEIWDSMKMASSTFASRPTYKKWCIENGYMTKHTTPRPRLTAEILYRYITKNHEFEESHTALEDVKIESIIVQTCFKSHMKMDRVLFERMGD